MLGSLGALGCSELSIIWPPAIQQGIKDQVARMAMRPTAAGVYLIHEALARLPGMRSLGSVRLSMS